MKHLTVYRLKAVHYRMFLTFITFTNADYVGKENENE